MQPITLEFICTANEGRSKPAETIAEALIYQQHEELVDLIDVRSSGTQAAAIERMNNGRFLEDDQAGVLFTLNTTL